MKSIITLSIALITGTIILCSVPICAKNVQWDSKLISQPVQIESKRANWPEGTLAFLKDDEVSVGLCNDSQNLYIMLSFKNPQYARLIRVGGITIWLDNTGRNKKNFMIRFTSGPTNEDIRALNANNPQLLDRELPPEIQERMKGMNRDTASTLVCYEKDRIVEKQIPLDGSEGPLARFGIDKGFFVYEFRIPLKESSVRNYGISASQNQNISIGIIWGDMEHERTSPKIHMGEPSQGGGMNPPEGMPENRGHEEMGQRQGGFGRMQKDMKHEIWLKTKLGISGNK